MKPQGWRILSLFILVFEGFGIRILDDVIPSPISFWTALLFIINFRSIRKLPIKTWLTLFAFFAFYIVFSLLKGVTPNFFLLAAWFSAFFVLSNYYDGKANFAEDFYRFTKYCVIYSLLHFPIIILAKDFLIPIQYELEMKTFMYLFYYAGAVNETLGLNRTQGFCWEPSCWNCLLNMNLALSLSLNKKRADIILCAIAIFLVFSTTGFVTMLFIFGTYFALYLRKLSIRSALIIAAILLIILPVAISNIENKLTTGSGATRYGDFFVALYVVQNSPLLGGDLNNITSDAGAMMAKADNWGQSAESLRLYDEVGMTNAFAALFVEWGLIVTCVVLYMMFASPFFPTKRVAILVSSALLVVLMGTPIARTGFFYLFPLSTLIIKKKAYGINFNSNSNIQRRKDLASVLK